MKKIALTLCFVLISCAPQKIDSVQTKTNAFISIVNQKLQQKKSKMIACCKEIIRVTEELMQARCLRDQAKRENITEDMQKYNKLCVKLFKRYNYLHEKIAQTKTEIEDLQIEVSEWDAKHPGWWRRGIDLTGIDIEQINGASPMPVEVLESVVAETDEN